MHKSPDQRLTEVRNFIAEPYVWPGGYPLVLYFENGEACCAECAAENYDQIVDDTYKNDRGDWAVAGVSPHFEGPPEFCASCGTAIESAYGTPTARVDTAIPQPINSNLKRSKVMKLSCILADICLPDYWGGHHLPHVAVPVSRDTSISDLRDSILDELRMGAVAGADATPETTYENDEWYEAACEAVERDVQPRDPNVQHPFRDLDTSDDDDAEPVYAYFVFHREG